MPGGEVGVSRTADGVGLGGWVAAARVRRLQYMQRGIRVMQV